MEDCIFCKILKGKLPSTKVYENEDVLVFKDIHPRAPIHFLIIPKKHIDDFHNVTDENIYLQIINVINKMVDQFELMKKGYRVVVNGGGAQLINHLHFQLLGEITKTREV